MAEKKTKNFPRFTTNRLNVKRPRKIRSNENTKISERSNQFKGGAIEGKER